MTLATSFRANDTPIATPAAVLPKAAVNEAPTAVAVIVLLSWARSVTLLAVMLPFACS